MTINKRVFVSFDNYCPFQCKHCFSYGIKREKERSTDEIVDSLDGNCFDIIYVSQKNDNFYDPQRGLQLCKKLFDRYKSNLFIITRNVFNAEQLIELDNLKRALDRQNKKLFIAISLNAIESIGVSEDTAKVPSPDQRMEFIKALGDRGFEPILMLRPIFPNSIIPVSECIRVIEKTQESISCVVASGLGINNRILQQLGMKEDDFLYDDNQEYLLGAIDCEIRFVKVCTELSRIKEKCRLLNIPFFEHSMPAINYLLEKHVE